jgi:hypothetical protein
MTDQCETYHREIAKLLDNFDKNPQSESSYPVLNDVTQVSEADSKLTWQHLFMLHTFSID